MLHLGLKVELISLTEIAQSCLRHGDDMLPVDIGDIGTVIEEFAPDKAVVEFKPSGWQIHCASDMVRELPV